MITNSTVHVCDGCGFRAPGSEQDEKRPAGLMGLLNGGGKQQGLMGTVEVAEGNGEFTTKPWYAHRLACVRTAIDRVVNGLLPPSTNGAVTDDE